METDRREQQFDVPFEFFYRCGSPGRAFSLAGALNRGHLRGKITATVKEEVPKHYRGALNVGVRYGTRS